MISINRVTLLGHLGRDPDLKLMGNGNAVLTLSLATNSREYKVGEDPKTHTEWHRVVIWGKRAEGLFKFLRKGMQVWVEGPMRTTHYEKDGVTMYSTHVLGHVVQVQGKGADDGPKDFSDVPF
jgi:single-strand DNA-binding protein